MTTILKSGKPLDELTKEFEKATSKKGKGVDTDKYSGVLTPGIDPLEFQKKIRDEWR